MSESRDSRSGVELARRALIVSVVATAVVCAALLLWKASNVVLVLFGAVLLSVLLSGMAGWMASRTPLSHRFSLVVVLLLLVAVLVAGTVLFAPRVAEQFDELSRTIPGSIAELEGKLQRYEWGRWILARMPEGEELMSPSAAAQRAGRYFSSIAGGVTTVVVVCVAGIFLAMSPEMYRRGLLLMVPRPRRERADEVLVALESTLSWWIIGRLASMTVIGVMTWIGLMLLDIPLAFSLGLIAGLLSFVPYIGPVLSAVPAILLALAVDPTRALHVALLYLGIQFVESNLLTPLIEKKTVWLPPALTIGAQLFAGLLFGILGVILATPLTAVALVLVKMLYLEDLLGEDVEVSRAT